jgi:cytochrome P450
MEVSMQSQSDVPEEYILDFDPFNPPDRDDPHPTLRRAREEKPVFYSRALRTWVVTRYDDVIAVLRDPERFSSANAITNIPQPPPPEVLAVLATGVPYEPNSVDLDPPRHTTFRGLIHKAFTPGRIQAMAPQIRRLAEDLVDTFVADSEVDLVSGFAYPLPTRVIGGLLGVPATDMQDFKRWSDEWMILLGQLGERERVVRAAREVVAFQRYVERGIAERRKLPQDDLLSAIVTTADALPEPPSDAALISLVMTVLFAGHETTTSLITNTIRLLLRHPEQLDLVRSERSLVPAAITEALRFDPPVPGMYRTATTDVKIAGVTLPAGSHIQLNFASANRDEHHFTNPDRFDIRRADKASHLSFGRGIHTCIGAALAQLEGQIAVNVLLDRLPDLRLVPGQTIIPVVSATVRGTRSLRVRWDRP